MAKRDKVQIAVYPLSTNPIEYFTHSRISYTSLFVTRAPAGKL